MSKYAEHVQSDEHHDCNGYDEYRIMSLDDVQLAPEDEHAMGYADYMAADWTTRRSMGIVASGKVNDNGDTDDSAYWYGIVDAERDHDR